MNYPEFSLFNVFMPVFVILFVLLVMVLFDEGTKEAELGSVYFQSALG